MIDIVDSVVRDWRRRQGPWTVMTCVNYGELTASLRNEYIIGENRASLGYNYNTIEICFCLQSGIFEAHFACTNRQCSISVSTVMQRFSADIMSTARLKSRMYSTYLQLLVQLNRTELCNPSSNIKRSC